MRLDWIKTEKQVSTQNDIGYNIKRWGLRNDFPDKLKEIVAASGTAYSSLGVYIDFLIGKGLKNKDLEGLVVNSKGDTLITVMNRCKADYGRYNAFILHVNISGSYTPVELTHIPFDYFRLGIEEKSTKQIKYAAIFDNWGRRKNNRINSIDDLKPEEYPLYSFNPDVLRERLAEQGDFINSNGFIAYFNESGDQSYPEPIYLPLVTNMRSEEGLYNVLGRNICNNFLTAGAIIDIVNTDPNAQEEEKTKSNLLGFQGDYEACQIMYIPVKSKEEVPQFVPFQGTNYDKQYTFSAEYIPSSIGRIFKQPPILRMENVSEGLSSNKMKEAYTIYNTVTQRPRDFVDSTFTRLLQGFPGFPSDAVIDTKELSFSIGSSIVEKYGENTANRVDELLSRSDISPDDKLNRMVYIYGVDQEDAEILIENLTPAEV